MPLVRRLLLIVVASLTALPAAAQYTTNITLQHLLAKGQPVPYATVCAQAVNQQGTTISFSEPTWGLMLKDQPLCAPVVNGAIAGGLNVPDAQHTTFGSPIFYTITIQQQNAAGAAIGAPVIFSAVPNVYGSTFALDNFSYPQGIQSVPSPEILSQAGIPSSCTEPSLLLEQSGPAAYMCHNGTYVVLQLGSTGPQGPPGCVIGTTCVGALTTTPSATQTVVQPAGTTLAVNDLNSVLYPAAGSVLTTAVIASVCNGTTPGRIMLPAGTITFSTMLTVPAYCTIQGQGMGISTLQLAANTQLLAPGAIINTREGLSSPPGTLDTNITLQDFTLDLNTAHQTAASEAIWMANVQFVTLDHVEVNGGMVHFGTPQISSASATYTHDITIIDSNLHNAGISPAYDEDALQFLAQNVLVSNTTLGPSSDSGTGLLGYGTAHIVYTGNIFTNNPQTCGVAGGAPAPNTALDPNLESNDVIISNNTITCDGTNGFGISVNQGKKWTISHNTIHATPVLAGTQTAPAINVESASDVTVSGNQIDGAKFTGISLSAYGQEVLRNVSVTGNTVRNTNSAGIGMLVTSSTNPGATFEAVTVTGNDIINPGNGVAGPGILVAQGATGSGVAQYVGVSISDNSIVDDQATHTMTYGIQYNGFPNLSVANNNISGYTSGAYQAHNPGTVFSTHVDGDSNSDSVSTQTLNLAAVPAAGSKLNCYTNNIATGYSPITQAADSGCFFDVGGALGSGAFVLASHSGSSTGFRVDGLHNLVDLWGGTINLHTSALQINGTSTFSGTKTAGSCVFTITLGLITAVTGC